MSRIAVALMLITLTIVVLANLHPQAVSQETRVPMTGDAKHGAQLFKNGVNGAPACSMCHLTGEATGFSFSVGPNLQGVAQRAGMRIEGMSAEEYLRNSILTPAAYLVGGYRDMMFPRYQEKLSEQELADIIAYLMTL